MKEIILATSNPGKIAEMQEILAPIHCISQKSLSINDADETGLTFIENALIKARHASLISQKPALGDDSGLVVPALNGAPGIYSARFAGENASTQQNINLLLEKLETTSARQAFFYCTIVYLKHAYDPTPLITTGKLNGLISYEPIGNNGFGYDPIFYLPNYECTVAELPKEVKNQISHRAQALNNLKKELDNL